MAYGMQQLRKAGQALVDLDTKYAQAVGKGLGENPNPIRGMTSAVPLKDVFVNPGQADTIKERIALHAMDVGVLGSNIASRYALPAGGVTLAGKALYDMTAAFGSQADYPEQGQLSL